jgi:hypothetical protein
MNGSKLATPNSELRTLTAGCLLCGQWFKNKHGVSIHVGKIHNNRKRDFSAKDRRDLSEVEERDPNPFESFAFLCG